MLHVSLHTGCMLDSENWLCLRTWLITYARTRMTSHDLAGKRFDRGWGRELLRTRFQKDRHDILHGDLVSWPMSLKCLRLYLRASPWDGRSDPLCLCGRVSDPFALRLLGECRLSMPTPCCVGVRRRGWDDNFYKSPSDK